MFFITMKFDLPLSVSWVSPNLLLLLSAGWQLLEWWDPIIVVFCTLLCFNFLVGELVVYCNVVSHLVVGLVFLWHWKSIGILQIMNLWEYCCTHLRMSSWLWAIVKIWKHFPNALFDMWHVLSHLNLHFWVVFGSCVLT